MPAKDINLSTLTTYQKLVSDRFPNVNKFRVEYMLVTVDPVKYKDANGLEANEYPPVVCWQVGEQHYSYVMKPSFRRVYIGGLLRRNAVVRADYSLEQSKVWKLLQWSSEGKTAGEINHLLGNLQGLTKAAQPGQTPAATGSA